MIWLESSLSSPGTTPLLHQLTFFLFPAYQKCIAKSCAEPGAPPGLNSCSMFTGLMYAGCFPQSKQAFNVPSGPQQLGLPFLFAFSLNFPQGSEMYFSVLVMRTATVAAQKLPHSAVRLQERILNPESLVHARMHIHRARMCQRQYLNTNPSNITSSTRQGPKKGSFQSEAVLLTPVRWNDNLKP